jgi:hypothetical protein
MARTYESSRQVIANIQLVRAFISGDYYVREGAVKGKIVIDNIANAIAAPTFALKFYRRMV